MTMEERRYDSDPADPDFEEQVKLLDDENTREEVRRRRRNLLGRKVSNTSATQLLPGRECVAPEPKKIEEDLDNKRAGVTIGNA